jgi:hypothetical protein
MSDWILTGDQQSDGTQNPHMTREWDGLGNTTDSIDYSPSVPPGATDVDSLANLKDLFFEELVNDVATLLVSPKQLQNDPAGGLNEIYFRTATPFGSLPGVWAKNFTIGDGTPAGDDEPPEGIDGLEVWGSGRDHNLFSLYGDPPDQAGRKVSLFLHDVVNNTSAPFIYNDEIRTAIGLQPVDPDIDLDGSMMFDDNENMVFDAGDSVLFSISENLSAGGPFDGGEIWVWDFGSPATFLVHGGVTWDTANSPALLFGWGGPNPFELDDINALEAIFVVPEPSSFVLLLVGLITAFGRRRQT